MRKQKMFCLCFFMLMQISCVRVKKQEHKIGILIYCSRFYSHEAKAFMQKNVNSYQTACHSCISLRLCVYSTDKPTLGARMSTVR